MFNKIRSDFPILQNKVYDKPLIYLDSAASAQKPSVVIETMRDLLMTSYGNVHRGMHYLSNQSTAIYEEAREAVARFINSQLPEEIIFTKNATEAINLVAYSWGMNNLKSGDEIILSILEHHANIVPWNFLREKLGVKIKFIYLTHNGTLNIDEFKKALSNKTKLVAITHMSNVTGQVLPIKEISVLAHSLGAKVLIDGSQGIVHNKVDVQEIDCDWYAFTGHKLYAATGIGVLYGKKHILENQAPFLGGGEMIETVTENEITYNELPFKFEAGTPPIIEAASLKAAIKYIEGIGLDNIHNYENELMKYAISKLKQLEDITYYGDLNQSKGIISFNIKDIHPHDLASYLDNKGIAIRAGTHCAQPLLAYFGITACSRASISFYNNKNDIDSFIDGLANAKRFFYGFK